MIAVKLARLASKSPIFRLEQLTWRSVLNVAGLRLHSQGIAHPHAPSPEAIVTQLGAVQAQDYHGAL